MPDYDSKHRSTQSELMDHDDISYEDINNCLHDLAIINHFTLAYRPTLQWIKERFLESNGKLSILDVGCGSGDMLREILKWTTAHNYQVHLVGLDLNPLSKISAEESTKDLSSITFVTSDIFTYAPIQPYDYIICSNFTHHLSNESLTKFIQWLQSHAKLGWFINDLHRHWLSFIFIRYATRFLKFNYMIQHDAPISVARAFKKRDWARILNNSNIELDHINIDWFFPFRYCVSNRI